ncbi:MAG: DUF4390 domain-containing protein [Candidatus Parcubacteria bacterium]|nr:DUF4390 domain-containing protein [Burkholderiales bacterium]
MRGFALLKKLLAAFALGGALASALPARADDIEVADARLTATEEGIALSADFAFELNPRLAEVVTNGVPLYFAVEFELTRPRWYWFDEKAAVKRLQLRLSYHALSRHYRLSTGVLQRNYTTLEEALNVLRRVRNWQVLDRSVTLANASYDAAVRMRLDQTLLPKPFQLSAITNRELNLESPWRRFSFRPSAVLPSPAEMREPREVETEAR